MEHFCLVGYFFFVLNGDTKEEGRREGELEGGKCCPTIMKYFVGIYLIICRSLTSSCAENNSCSEFANIDGSEGLPN